MEQKDSIHEALFDLSLQIKRLLQDRPSNPSPPESEKRMKLSKIDVLMFNGNILHWNTFWEQFEVPIHSTTQLPNAAKLAYPRHAVKGGPTNQVIEGLSQSADQYEQAIGG